MNCNAIVIDTPNVVFNNKHRGKRQVRDNVLSLIKLILGVSVHLIVIITPKMIRELPDEVEFLADVVREVEGEVVFSRARDPDEVALSLAERYHAPVVTNDRFRQRKYARFGATRERAIRFQIRNVQIVLEDRN